MLSNEFQSAGCVVFEKREFASEYAHIVPYEWSRCFDFLVGCPSTSIRFRKDPQVVTEHGTSDGRGEILKSSKSTTD